MPFEFATSGRILFGRGSIQQAGAIAAGFGRQALIIHGKRPEPGIKLQSILEQSGVRCELAGVPGEPTLEWVEEIARQATSSRPDLVIGIGGGSAIDAGKSVAAMAVQPGQIMDYLEVIGSGKAISVPPLPFVAIPTTAGTGSEVTRNAVITARQLGIKVSLRSPLILPKAAVVDPELMVDMPGAVTASTGLDAFTQLLEPFTSRKANPMTDAFCREGLGWVARSLKPAYENGQNMEAREGMALAALFSGLALANAGLGAAHGLAAPLGGMTGAPHGALCARLVGAVVQVNQAAILEREPQNLAMQRLQEAAQILSGDPEACVQDLLDWIEGCTTAMQIPRLQDYGIKKQSFAELAGQAARSSSMQANPILLQLQEIMRILELAY